MNVCFRTTTCQRVAVLFVLLWGIELASADTPPNTTGASDVADPSPSPVNCLTQSFDNLIVPALPRRWTAENAAGPPPLWVTSSNMPDAGPNAAFVDDPATISDKSLETPTMVSFSTSLYLYFRHSYALEPVGGGSDFFDGAVLEISVDGGAYVDITDPTVGGTFVTGGYNGRISTAFSSPIAGRMAWGQSSGDYIQTIANIPNVSFSQFVRFRFHVLGYQRERLWLARG